MKKQHEREFFYAYWAALPTMIRHRLLLPEKRAEVVAMARSLKNFLKFGSFEAYIKVCPRRMGGTP